MPARNKILDIFKKIMMGIRKLFTLNIGTIIFGALFIYMLITVFLYITADHVTSYEVISGPLTKNQTYTGIALRTEEIVAANSPGYVTYYAREGTKVRKNGTIYAVGDTKSEEQEVKLTEEDLSGIRSQMAKFAYNFSPNTFHNIYSFKYELEGSILQSAGIIGSSSEKSVTLGDQTIYNSASDGVIIYSTDGFETLNANDVTQDTFNQMSYHKTDLISDKPLKAGDNVYKLITNEAWSLMIPLTDKQASALSDRTSIRVKFLKDGSTQIGTFSILEMDGTKFGKLDFSNGMVRYASDRYLEIELVTNNKTGLKIPMSSVVSKEFYVIPEEYVTQGANQNEAGFLVETKSKDGTKKTEFVNTTLYEHKDKYYYIEKSDLQEGDTIVRPKGTERYTVSAAKSLEGVYSMNKGYAVFRKISIIEQNKEYCIVENNTSYGIAQFDHIVLNGSSVKEEDILY